MRVISYPLPAFALLLGALSPAMAEVVVEDGGIDDGWHRFEVNSASAARAMGCDARGEHVVIGDPGGGSGTCGLGGCGAGNGDDPASNVTTYKYELEIAFDWSACSGADAEENCQPTTTRSGEGWVKGQEIPAPAIERRNELWGEKTWMAANGNYVAIGHSPSGSVRFFAIEREPVVDMGVFYAQEQPEAWSNATVDSTWIEVASITGLDEGMGGVFAINDAGNRIVLGQRAFVEDDNGGSRFRDSDGRVEVWDRAISGEWVRTARIASPTPARNTGFGSAVGISGDGSTVVIGAPYYVPPGIDNPETEGEDERIAIGAAYVYARTFNAYVSRGRLEVAEPTDQMFSGFSVDASYSGGMVYVGIPGYSYEKDPEELDRFEIDPLERNVGGVAVWQRRGTGYEGVGVITSNDAQEDGGFGVSVSARGRSATIAVGEYGRSSGSVTLNGAAHVGTVDVSGGRFRGGRVRFGAPQNAAQLGFGSASCVGGLAMFGEPGTQSVYINGSLGSPNFFFGSDEEEDGEEDAGGTIRDDGLVTVTDGITVPLEAVVELAPAIGPTAEHVVNIVESLGSLGNGLICGLFQCEGE